MKTLLLAAAGVIVGILVLAGLAALWLGAKIGAACQEIARMAIAGGITPFRIHLERPNEIAWHDEKGLERATRHIEGVGYQRVGEFTVRELEAVRLRAFWHPETQGFLALYDHDDAGLFADLFHEFDDGTSVTISTAPESGMDHPSHAPNFRLGLDVREAGVARALHERLAHEAIGKDALGFGVDDFEQAFTEAYAQEMDWRIARGGVTKAEIERIAAIQGMEPPSASQVEAIHEMWRAAIGGFIEEEATRAWLAEASISGLEWERLRPRIQVVHDYCEPDELVDLLGWSIALAEADPNDDEALDRAHAAAVERLTEVMQRGVPRDAFARAQELVPEKRRYERLAALDSPWPAEIWAGPQDDA